jgi:hypothetical protein
MELCVGAFALLSHRKDSQMRMYSGTRGSKLLVVVWIFPICRLYSEPNQHEHSDHPPSQFGFSSPRKAHRPSLAQLGSPYDLARPRPAGKKLREDKTDMSTMAYGTYFFRKPRRSAFFRITLLETFAVSLVRLLRIG